MPSSPDVVREVGRQLTALGWVSDLLVGGSVASGDYLPAVSDIDLVAVVKGPMDAGRLDVLSSLHRGLDSSVGLGLRVGCVYADEARVLDPQARHATWTHGSPVMRILSGVTRAELVRHGYAVFGRTPLEILPAMSDDEVRRAALAELTGYWAWAIRRPTLWLDTAFADLSLLSMARGRHTMATGELITKTQAVDLLDAPAWLIDQIRRRRRCEDVASPRLRAAAAAWRDAHRTVTHARLAPHPQRNDGA